MSDLDPGYLVTHDDPHHANVELAARQAKMRALIGRVVWLPDVGSDAVVVKAFAPEVVNVVCLGNYLPMLSVQGFEVHDYDWARFVCVVFYRHSSGVQYVALVTGINDAQQFELLVLGDGCVDLGKGPGVPVAMHDVTHGVGRHLCWQTELDA